MGENNGRSWMQFTRKKLYDVVKDEDVALKAMEAAEEVIINTKKHKKK